MCYFDQEVPLSCIFNSIITSCSVVSTIYYYHLYQLKCLIQHQKLTSGDRYKYSASSKEY